MPTTIISSTIDQRSKYGQWTVLAGRHHVARRVRVQGGVQGKGREQEEVSHRTEDRHPCCAYPRRLYFSQPLNAQRDLRGRWAGRDHLRPKRCRASARRSARARRDAAAALAPPRVLELERLGKLRSRSRGAMLRPPAGLTSAARQLPVVLPDAPRDAHGGTHTPRRARAGTPPTTRKRYPLARGARRPPQARRPPRARRLRGLALTHRLPRTLTFCAGSRECTCTSSSGCRAGRSSPRRRPS